MVKISVIIPNYNNEKYIERCINSVICQTEQNFEIIFIDDGSSDNSVELVEKIQKHNDVKIRIIKQFNQNASVARNRGIELINSEFCYFLDSDDYIYDKNCFCNMINKIGDNDLLIGNYKIVNQDNQLIDIYKNINDLYDYNNIFKYCGISPVPSNKLFRSSIIKNNQIYFANVKIGQDLNFFLKYLFHCKKVKLIDEYLYCYRVVLNGMSNRKSLNFIDIYNSFNDVKKYYNKYNSESYDRYIKVVAIKHYHNQLVKVRLFNDYKLRRILYKYFAYIISHEKHNSLCKKKYMNYELKIYYAKKLLLLLRAYDLLKNIKNRKRCVNNEK